MVQLTAFIETCCYDCENWVKGPLRDAFYTQGWLQMSNLTLEPYGKCNQTYDAATSEYDFSCQHGQYECMGNMVMACAVSKLYAFDAAQYVPFIIDYMAGTYGVAHNGCKSTEAEMVQIAQTVCNDINESKGQCDWDALSECFEGKEGNAVYHQV